MISEPRIHNSKSTKEKKKREKKSTEKPIKESVELNQQPRRSLGTRLLIGIGSAVLVGGAIAAAVCLALFLKPTEETTTTITTTTPLPTTSPCPYIMCYYRNYTQTCNTTNQCRDNQNLQCLAGICNCTNTDYWNNASCIARQGEFGTCNSNLHCLQPMTCSTQSQCRCQQFEYFDTIAGMCKPQGLVNATCVTTTQCRTDLNLQCTSGKCQCISLLPVWLASNNTCIPYKPYGMTTCSSNSECDTSKLLICNSGTGSSCNCPTTSVLGMCDCSKINGNEMYWTGSTCTIALSYGSSCLSPLSEYLCQTITQVTVCNNTSGSYKCECAYLKYFHLSINKCLNQLSYNSSCSQSNACRVDQNLICSSGICKCNNVTQFWSSALQSCVNYRTYAESCTSTSECNSKLSLICNSGNNSCNCPITSILGICDCPRVNGSEMYWNGTSCTLAKSYLSLCTANYTCKTISQGTHCNGTTCTCLASGSFKTALNKCSICTTNWDNVGRLCYFTTTVQGNSNIAGTSSEIQSRCGGRSDARLAKVDDVDIYHYLLNLVVTLRRDYFVDAFQVGGTGTNYTSHDGLWILNSTYLCPPTGGDCVVYSYSNMCFQSHSCGNNRYFLCQYTP